MEDNYQKQIKSLHEKVEQLQLVTEQKTKENSEQRQQALQRERELEASITEYTKALVATQHIVEEKSGMCCLFVLNAIKQTN